MTKPPRICLIEDDREILDLLCDYLKRQGLRVEACPSGAAFDRFQATFGDPDLIVLDLMLPGEDGLSICRRVRASSRIPILILTAKGDEVDRIIGLEMGADDYLAKPFSPRELLARIRAILRRSEPPPNNHRRFQVRELIVDMDARSVAWAHGAIVELTSAEFDLFACLITHAGRVLSRDQLMDWTRGRKAEVFDRTIDVQLSRLRKKIETDAQPIIKTIRNAGYMLCEPVTEL